MRTITVLLYRRPELLQQMMSAVIQAQDIGKFDKLVFSVDGGDPQPLKCAAMATAVADLLTQEGVIDVEVLSRPENLGVAGHPLAALTHAFENLNSDFNVALEDDALIKPDLLRMMLWWQEFKPMMFTDCLLMAGCNHRDFGRNQQRELPEDDPSLIVESAHIPSPFCWATTKENWPIIKKHWNFKIEPPLGWDWSLSMMMRMTNKVAMHPILSRCQNIGRIGGEHESPATFDRTQTGLMYQETAYDGLYSLRAKIDRACLQQLDSWMVPEYSRRNNLPFTPWK